jgi:hypothetical protein
VTVHGGDGGLLRATRRGAEIVVQDAPRDVGPEAAPVGRAIGALVAGLRLAHLAEENAAALAEREGLVTHLTSLVLVDHDGAVVDDLPSMRKIALPSPRRRRLAFPATQVRHLRWFLGPNLQESSCLSGRIRDHLPGGAGHQVVEHEEVDQN